MKKFLLFMSAAVLATSLNTKAFADENLSLKSSAGVTPDSIFYKIDILMDNLKISITTNDAKKAEIISNVAEERLGESEVMADKGDEKLAKEALEQYNEKMSEAADTVKEAVNNVEDTDKTDKVEEVNQATQEVAQKQEQSIEILKNIQSKVGDSAKEVIGKVIEMQIAKKQAVANMVAKRHALNVVRKAYNMSKVTLNQAVNSGDQTAVDKAQQTLKTNEDALNKAKEELKTAFTQKQAVVTQNAQLKDQVKEEIENEVKNGTITETEKNEVKDIVNNKAKKAEKKAEIKKKIEERKNKKEEVKNTIKEKKNEIKEKVKENKEKAKALKQNKGKNNNNQNNEN